MCVKARRRLCKNENLSLPERSMRLRIANDVRANVLLRCCVIIFGSKDHEDIDYAF